MKMASMLCVCGLATMLPVCASAEVKAAAADGFLVEHRFEIAAPPAAAWQVLVRPERYWPSDHTWSGSAGNLSLRAEAGGCFCENWELASAEHGRVVMALPGSVLRIRGSLGPLLEMAVVGVLSVSLQAEGEGTAAVVTYRVSGDALHRLDELAPIVDEVVGIQFGGFAKLASGTSGR